MAGTVHQPELTFGAAGCRRCGAWVDDGLCSRSECSEWHGDEPDDEPAFDWADPDAYADEIDTALFYNRHADPYARIDVADEKPGCTFMLGTHRPHWLHPGKREHKPSGPLFVSVRQMRDRRKSAYPVSDVSFALDSGGFTELRKFNGWRTTEADYAAYVMRIADETLGHRAHGARTPAADRRAVPRAAQARAGDPLAAGAAGRDAGRLLGARRDV
jgi:hypothetical protein